MALQSSCYVLVGNEPVRRRHLLERLRSQAGSWERVSATNTSPQEVLTGNLLSDPDSPLIRVVEDYTKWTAAQRKVLTKTLKDGITPGLCIVVLIDRLGAKDPIREAVTGDSLIQLEQPAKGRYASWVVRQARLSGVGIDNPAAELLVGLLGEDTEALASELSKLSLLGDTATQEIIRSAVQGQPRSQIWGWIDALTTGRRREALVCLAACEVAEEAPIALLGALQNRLLGIAWAGLMNQSQSGMKDYPWRQAQTALRSGWDHQRIQSALLSIIQLDGELKGLSNLDGYTQLARLSSQGI